MNVLLKVGFPVLLMASWSHAQPIKNHEATFEQSYKMLEQKLDQLKASGRALTEESRKEIAALMAQMNHEHTQLRRAIEQDEQKASAKMTPLRETSRDWRRRIQNAAQNVGDGFKQAWLQISKPAKAEDDSQSEH